MDKPLVNLGTAFTSIGQNLPRADGRRKVIGAATYTAEWQIPGLTYGAVVDSAIARGTVRAIDASAALAAPGVLAVVTHENAPRLHALPSHGAGQQITGEGGLGEERQPLQDGTIHYGAQSVAVVVADTPEQARHAATLVRVTYNSQPPELDWHSARRQKSPKMFAGTDLLQQSADDARKAIAEAPVRLERRYDSSINHHNPMEMLASIAQWDRRDGEEFLTLYDTTRAVSLLRDVCAKSFGLPSANVRVVSHFLGGAFGAKSWTFFNPLLVALAARVVKRPLKIEWRRQQMFSVAGHRPATQQTLSLGASREGRISGLVHDSCTHSSPVSGYIEPVARMTSMMYDIPNIGFSNRVSHLNLPSPCVMRGPGMVPGGWLLECMLDELACELAIDPVELRLRNYAEKNPATGQPFFNKRLRECYARGRGLFGWDSRPSAPGARRVGNHVIGQGIASSTHPALQMGSSAQATIFADGRARVRSATHEIGNGAYTALGQIAADGFGLPVDRVRIELGDTNFPTAIPAMGSMTTSSVGPAVLSAARSALAALKELAIRDVESPLFGAAFFAVDAREGRLFLRAQPSVGEEYGTILRRVGRTEIVADSTSPAGKEIKQPEIYSFGAVFAEVRVDEATGVVRVARLCGVYDVGRIINPRTAHSQLMGGMIFALGATLMEESLYDPHSGLPVIRNLADYHIPSCADTPQIQVEALNVPDPNIGELGAHGVGEMGCNGVPAAITNAVFNATGKRLRRLPITPDQLLTN